MVASRDNPASTATDEQAFVAFIRQYRKDLERIARHTCGEHERDDVAQEIWLMADAVARKTGVLRDFSNPAFQSLLLAFVYQKLVRYTELNVRYAVSLDHAPRHAENAEDAHPLLDRLAGSDGRDPLSDLLADEVPCHDACTNDGVLIGTNAGAWVVFLRQCDNRMRTVAARLLVSLSHAYHCMAKARNRAAYQNAMSLKPPDTAVPRLGAWRKKRHLRVPRQLTLDFDPRLAFPPPASEAIERQD